MLGMTALVGAGSAKPIIDCYRTDWLLFRGARYSMSDAERVGSPGKWLPCRANLLQVLISMRNGWHLRVAGTHVRHIFRLMRSLCPSPITASIMCFQLLPCVSLPTGTKRCLRLCA